MSVDADPAALFESFPIPADWSEMPPDEDVPPDEGDGGVADPIATEHVEPHSAQLVVPSPIKVPFPGTLRHGDHGRIVVALQRALRRAGCRHQPPTGRYQHRTHLQVALFQKRHGLAVDGVCGKATWHALNTTRPPNGRAWFDAYGYWLVVHTTQAQLVDDERSRIVRVAMWGYYHRAAIHYLQQRPMMFLNCPPEVDAYCDCSEFATDCYRCAHAPDPTGFHYNGWGNTDSMLAHGRATASPRPADLILYSNPGHVVVNIHWPMGVSHGSEGGPYYLDARYRPITSIRSYLP